MFRTSDIRRFISFVPENRAQQFLESLGRRGLVQFDYPEQFEREGIESRGGSISLKDLCSIREKATLLLDEIYEGEGNGKRKIISPPDYLFDSKKDLKWLAYIERKKSQYHRVFDIIRSHIERVIEEEDECRKLFLITGDMTGTTKNILLTLLYGSLPGGALSEMASRKNVFSVSTADRILLLLPQNKLDSILADLERGGFINLTSYMQDIIQRDGPGAELKRLHRRGEELQRRLDAIDKAYSDLSRSWLGRLTAMLRSADIFYDVAEAAQKSLPGKVLTLFAGWIPLRDKIIFQELLGEVCGDSHFLHIYSRREMRPWRGKIPVLLKNTSTLRPFETLVTVMGFPASGEVDPTPLAAAAYMIMFGVMFGDVGQGLVLSLTGFIIWRLTMGEKSVIGDIGAIMIFCGFTAAFFGLLYGSVFSNEHLITPLLFNPMHSMGTLFFGAIGMGAVLIVIGMLFGIINRLIEGNVLDALFHFKGLAGLLLYIVFVYSAAGLIFDFAIHSTAAAAVVIAALAMVLFRPLFFKFIPGHEDPLENGVFAWVVELIVELIETASSFVGNTISFIRAGAFALSHAGLSVAIYTLGDIVGGGFSAIAVIVIGNIFIILLEGLVCSIQAMRLEYYEFFSRFYSGKGEPFVPFTIQQFKGEERSWAVSG